jgi:hypothetical protein
MLKNIYLPSTVTMLLNNVVDGCTELESIYCYATTPPSLTASTFTNMPSNVTLYVPSESLSAYQNSNWANYFSNILPTSVPTPLYAVQSTDSSGANYNPVFQQWLYSNGYSAHSGYTTMAETLNLTEIPEQAFRDNTSLTHMDELQYFIKLTNIGDEAFFQCTNLISINIPISVRQIGVSAFDTCRELTSINIPDNVTSIGDMAFCQCGRLTSIIIPNSVTSIGDLAFDMCYNLTTATIGSGVTFIGEYAFYECNLSEVYCYATTPPTLEGEVFLYESGTNLYIPSGTGSAYRSASGWGDFKSYNTIL